MAEWSKRGTVNTFYRGSNPLKALNIKKSRLCLKHNPSVEKKNSYKILRKK